MIDQSEVSDQTIIIETEILSSGRLRCCRTPLSLQTPRKQKPESSEDARDVLVKPDWLARQGFCYQTLKSWPSSNEWDWLSWHLPPHPHQPKLVQGDAVVWDYQRYLLQDANLFERLSRDLLSTIQKVNQHFARFGCCWKIIFIILWYRKL